MTRVHRSETVKRCYTKTHLLDGARMEVAARVLSLAPAPAACSVSSLERVATTLTQNKFRKNQEERKFVKKKLANIYEYHLLNRLISQGRICNNFMQARG